MSEESESHVQKLRRETANTVMAYKRVFESEDGKLILKDMAKAFGWNEPSFICAPTGMFDPLFAAQRDGQRRILLRIEESLAQPSEPDGNATTEAKVIKPS